MNPHVSWDSPVDDTMTDLEMTKLCAEAMDFKLRHENTVDSWVLAETKGEPWDIWSPLYNNAQCMALEDWLIERGMIGYFNEKMHFLPKGRLDEKEWEFDISTKELRRRAIVECVAKMQFSRNVGQHSETAHTNKG